VLTTFLIGVGIAYSLTLLFLIHLYSKFDLETNLEYKWIKKSKVNEYAMPTPIKKVVSTL
jgi:hypothetical protein